MDNGTLALIRSQLIGICELINCSITFNSSDGRETRGSESGRVGADSTWQLRSAFAIMTMQSGFALLEAGFVRKKNLANIMVKNTADVGIGAVVYWLVGYGLSFGDGNVFMGWSHLADSACNSHDIDGERCTQYFFQYSFASTANTILSGAVAERISLKAYILFSILNEISYCLPVRWAWHESGWLAQLGFYDLAGTCVVHANGGVSALVAAVMIGPRQGRWCSKSPGHFGITSPVTALTGTLLLWWAWFSFNAGSTLGTSGYLWQLNSLIAINTLNGSAGGACAAIIASIAMKRGVVDVCWLINGILGGLVAVTGICSVTSSVESLLIGTVGALVAIASAHTLECLKVDDPVGAVPVHFVSSLWGTLAVGVFGRNDRFGTLGVNGLLHGGGLHLLGVQLIGFVAICGWSAVTTYIFLSVIRLTIGIRMSPADEEAGADAAEHGIHHETDGLRGIAPADRFSGDSKSVDTMQGLSPSTTKPRLPMYRQSQMEQPIASSILNISPPTSSKNELLNSKPLSPCAEAPVDKSFSNRLQESVSSITKVILRRKRSPTPETVLPAADRRVATAWPE